MTSGKSGGEAIGELSAIVARLSGEFKRAHDQGTVVPLQTFLDGHRPEFAADPAARRELLIELVKIELEARWRPAGDQATILQQPLSSVGGRSRLSDYALRYPELNDGAGFPLKLIAAEYELRQRWGDRPAPDEYLSQFPRQQAALVYWLAEADQRLQAESAKNVADRAKRAPVAAGAVAAVPAGTHTVETLPVAQDASGSTLSQLPLSGGGSGSGQADWQPSQVQRLFGEYELLQEIARGGMGVVFRARQLKLNRTVAIKMILAGQFASEEEVRRFYSEAEAAAKLDHPGIVAIHEVNQFQGQHYFCMAFIDGTSLAARIANGPLPPREAAELVRTVANAVQYAHSQGIIHRDLKPQNILLTRDNQPKVTDFGLAKTVEGDSGLTATGQILGTPSYMPPEQAAGNLAEIGPESDVYSLGAILYCLLTGRPPFQSANVMDTLRQVLEREPVAVRLLNPGVDRDLEILCLKCLEKEKSQRFASAHELAQELGRYLNGEPILSRPIGAFTRSWRWCRRNPLAAGLCAAILFVLVTIAGTVGVAQRVARTAREATRNQQIADLNGKFETALDQIQLAPSSLQPVEQLVDQLQLLSPERAEPARARIYQRQAETIDTALHQAKLEPAEMAAIEAALGALEARDSRRVPELRHSLALRQRVWEKVFELQAPFANLHDILDAGLVTVQPGGLMLKNPAGNGAQSSPAAGMAFPVPTRISSPGAVRLEAEFSGWAGASEVGLELNSAAGTGYGFLLATTKSPAPAASAVPAVTGTFGAARDDNAELVVRIVRNGSVLREQRLKAARLTSERLLLRATREGDQLSFQIADLPAVVFQDPFSLRGTALRYAVRWPSQGALFRLTARHLPRALGASPLETGDEDYGAGRLDEALSQFQAQGIAAVGELGQEARYKAAVVLLDLKRPEEAQEQLQRLSQEPGTRWPPLAAARVWLLHIRQRNLSDAEAVFARLSSQFNFEQLAALVPAEVRGEIVAAYADRAGGTVARHLGMNTNQVRNLERVSEVQRLLQPDGVEYLQSRVELAKAYALEGELGRALTLTGEMFRENPRIETAEAYLRYLRYSGEARRGLVILDRELVESQRETSERYLFQAYCHAHLEEWDQVEKDLEHFHRVYRHSMVHTLAALMEGFLRERRGDSSGAQEIWRKALPTERLESQKGMRGTLEYAILRSLTGQTDDTDTDIMVDKFSAQAKGTMSSALATLLPKGTIAATAREMWTSPRGRYWARRFAFDGLTPQEAHTIPLYLVGVEYFRQNALGKSFSPEQDEFSWNATREFYRAVTQTGKITTAHVLQLGMTWKGTTNILGWAGVAPNLEPALRAPFAYLFAHRFLRLNKPQEAEGFFRTALQDAPAGSPLAKLAQGDLELFAAQRGQLIIESEFSGPVRLEVRSGGNSIAGLDVHGRQQLELPAGAYELALSPESPELSLSTPRIDVALCGHPTVLIRWQWGAGTVEAPLPGLAAQPADLPGISRWQVLSKQPRDHLSVLARSPDGKLTAVGGQDGHIRLNDVATGRLTRIFVGHEKEILAVAWSPNGDRLASTSTDGTMRLWDVARGIPGPVQRGYSGAIRCVAWSRDGTSLATGGDGEQGGAICLWDSQGRPGAKMALKGSVRFLAWGPDGTELASADTDFVVRVWAANGEPIAVASQHSEAITGLDWSADGRWLASGSFDKTVRLWNPVTRSAGPILRPHEQAVSALAFSPDGSAIAVGTWGARNLLTLHRLEDQSLLWEQLCEAPLHSLRWVASGTHLVATREAKVVNTWQADGTPGAAEHFSDADLYMANWNPDQTRVAVSRAAGIQIWDIAAGKLELALSAPGTGGGPLAWSPNGSSLVWRAHDGTVRLWNVGTAVPINDLLRNRFGNGIGITWRPDSQQFAVADQGNCVLQVWNLDGTPGTTIVGLPKSPGAVAWSPNGKWLSVSGFAEDRLLRLWDAVTGKTVRTLAVDYEYINDLKWSADGRWLAAGMSSATVRLWNESLQSGPLLNSVQSVYSLAWSPDGKSIAAACEDGACRLWNIAGHPGPVLKGHCGPVFSVDWSPAGSEILTWGRDRTLRYWDSQTGSPLRLLLLLPNNQAAIFSASGQLLQSTPEADAELVYVVEKPTRELELLAPAEFRERLKAVQQR